MDAAYGTHALPGRLERLRVAGAGLGRGWLARRATGLIRRVVMAGRPGPFDVEPFPGQRARLYPSDNLSEKRVFSAPQFWDWAERAALARLIAATAGPFRFVDAGANVGLYTLAVRGMAGARLRALAIEPDPGNLARLRFNLAASGAEDAVRVAPVALAARCGGARMAAVGANRGEIGLGTGGALVATLPLLPLVKAAGFEAVDALKIDIEGHEAPVLEAFFAAAPRALWPRLLLLEARRGETTAALALVLRLGYVVAERTKLNVILAPGPGFAS